ncbi:MAG: hypothetical protein ACPG5T_03980 [Endozoicomonas sp.]
MKITTLLKSLKRSTNTERLEIKKSGSYKGHTVDFVDMGSKSNVSYKMNLIGSALHNKKFQRFKELTRKKRPEREMNIAADISKKPEVTQVKKSYDDYQENCTLLEEWSKTSQEMMTTAVSWDHMENQNRVSGELMPKREWVPVTMKQIIPMESIREEDMPAPFIFNYGEYRSQEKHNRLSGEWMPKPDQNSVKIAPMAPIEEEIMDLEELVDIEDIPTETDFNKIIYPAIQRCIKEGSMDIIPILLFAVDTPEKVMEVIGSNLLEDICKIQCAEHRVQVFLDVHEAISSMFSAEMGDGDTQKAMMAFSRMLELLIKEEKEKALLEFRTTVFSNPKMSLKEA